MKRKTLLEKVKGEEHQSSFQLRLLGARNFFTKTSRRVERLSESSRWHNQSTDEIVIDNRSKDCKESDYLCWRGEIFFSARVSKLISASMKSHNDCRYETLKIS